MKKIILICLPFIALTVILLGSNVTFKSLLTSISELDFKIPDFLEMKNVLETIKSLTNFADVPWYQYPLRIVALVSQLGNLVGATIRFVVLFAYDFIYNVVQVLGMFGRLVLN